MPLVPRRLTALALGAALAGLAGGVVPPALADAGSVSVRQVFTVPGNGAVPVTGKGYGHGHGMSQYGARGAARQGLSHQRILAFYYPGTTLGRAGGFVRVRITADADGDTRVPVQAGLRVREVDSGRTRALAANVNDQRVTSWRLRTSGSTSLLEALTGDRWRSAGSFAGTGAFYRTGAEPVTLTLPSGSRTYRGTLRQVGGSTINVVGLDNLVRGVVAAEMPASWEKAAVRSQAVAARTYALFEREANASRSYDTCDTTSCQVYGGVGAENPLANQAVTDTARQVLRYDGKAAFTQFSSSSGGWTSKGSRPYLVDKEDPYDAVSGNPNHQWTTSLTRARIQSAYSSIGTLQRIVVTQRNGHGQWRGRVERLVLDGSRADVTLTGSQFRSAFGLRSDWFAFG